MDTAADLSVLAAAIATGLVAGLFFAYTNSVMPALRGADDRAFVDVMQRVNVVILNPLFLAVFVGGLLVGGFSAVAVGTADDTSGLAWVLAGLVLYLVMIGITRAVNIPLNDELAAAGDVATTGDAGAARARFETRWVTWNTVRAVVSAAAFACVVAAALVR